MHSGILRPVESRTVSSASVIIRSQDSARTIGATFESVRRQTVDVELIVIDSGSQDETLALAERYCDKLLRIPASEYMPGLALNRATEAAGGDVVVALSSHCALGRADWIALALAHYEDERVAAASGALTDHHGTPLGEPLRQWLAAEDRGGGVGAFARRASLDPAYAYWGFSNHAASWRRSVWEQHRFDEGVVTLEDKEWAWRVLANGWTVVFDPALWVEQTHRWQIGAIPYFRRERREQAELARLVDLPSYGAGDAIAEWWRVPADGHGRLFHLLNYRRAAGLAGKYAGRRN
jgi:rhamnosyltransferase